MALQDMPLSDLDSASSVGNLDLMYLVQNGESKKVTAQTLIGEKADLSNGKLLLAQFPNTSKEVLNDTARFALTTNDVRNGFIVVVSQPTEKMYLVTDETNLNNASGYTAFAADAMWSSIQDKPTNLVVYETSGNVSTLKSEGGTALNPKTTTEALVDENGVSCKDRIAYGEESASVTVEPMSPYLHESDIVNDLATNDPTKPLSAAQGYALNSNLTECVKKNPTADITIATASGRTIAQALNLLINSSKWDISKVNAFSYIKIGVAYYRVSSVTASRVVFTYDAVNSSNYNSVSLYAQAGSNYAYTYNGSTVTSTGGDTLSNDLEFYY